MRIPIRPTDGRPNVAWLQQLPLRRRSLIVSAVCGLLLKEYGSPRLGNPLDPLDDLVYITVSNRTDRRSAQTAFRSLKLEFPDWLDALQSPPRRMRSLIEPAGLAGIKSAHLRKAFSKIQRDLGDLTLDPLRRMSTSEAHEYLTTLPGVSDKVAKCVLMYTLDRQVLPVDVHVHRIAQRLGWTLKRRADQCHDELERLVPPENRFAFHVDCIVHGREYCRPRLPRCDTCCIGKYCHWRGE